MQIENNRETLIQIATMYYMGDMTQQEIAAHYGITRTKVSRVLKRCRELKIVEFKINSSTNRLKTLEEKIQQIYNIREVIVVPSGSTCDDSKKNVGYEASKYIEKNLEDHMNIGIAWGGTIKEVIKNFSTNKICKNANVIQLAGGLHTESTNLSGREMANVLAIKMKAKCSLLQVPLVVRNGLLKKLLLNEPEVKKHFEKFKHLDMAVVGLGSSIPEKCATYRAEYITLDESKKLIEDGYVGDICGNRIDKEGKIGETFLKDRVISIDLQDLKMVTKVIAVACQMDKADSIIAGAKGRFYNVLIIDELAALAVLQKSE